jgi:hypothetical protein
MAYSGYKSLNEIEKTLGFSNQRKMLFGDILPVLPSDNLVQALENALELPVKSEKAKSELIVTPILLELRQQNKKAITFYSGDFLNVDDSRGLVGECDFILAKETGSFEVKFPIMQLVEAKRNDIEIGIPQCAAQMVGAQLYNEQNGVKLDALYGCVTTGDDWIFLKLVNKSIEVDIKKYYLNDLPTLLGIFQNIINKFIQQVN